MSATSVKAPPNADPGQAPTLTDRDLLALQQLANLYWALADGTEEAEIRDLFLEDGVLELGSLRLAGAAAIETFFRDRAAGQRASRRTTRHFTSNFLAVPIGADQARVRSSVMVFSGSGEWPLDASAPSGIADFEDLCTRSASGRWRYAQRTGQSVFIGEGAPRFAR